MPTGWAIPVWNQLGVYIKVVQYLKKYVEMQKTIYNVVDLA